MNYTVDQKHIRSVNQRVILNTIINTDTISRAALSRLVGMSKSAMTEYISSLLEMGIIIEVGEGQSTPTGGRKPILLKFNKNYKYIIAIDLSFEDSIFVLSNLGGEIINKISKNVDSASSYAERSKLVKDTINKLISMQNLKHDDIAIIAISSPGVAIPSKEFIANPQFANWRINQLTKELEDHFNTSVLVVNDVNAAAVGELKYGIGSNVDNLVYISCGLGVGAGIIINGSLYEGATKSAGEIGNFIIPSKNGLTSLENSININALLRYISEEAPKQTLDKLIKLNKSSKFSFKNVVSVWQTGDKFLQDCILKIAEKLGYVISDIISLLNCDLVILGGEYQVFKTAMLPLINHIVKENAFYPVEVVPSSMQYPGIYGLFALSYELILEQLSNASPKNNINF